MSSHWSQQIVRKVNPGSLESVEEISETMAVVQADTTNEVQEKNPVEVWAKMVVLVDPTSHGLYCSPDRPFLV
jgi:hypothetical protein